MRCEYELNPRNLTLRHREAMYAKGRKVRAEYAILANMRADGAYLTIQRRDRQRFDGDRDIVCDLEDWR